MKESLRPRRMTTGLIQAAIGAVIISNQGGGLKRHGLAETRGDAVGPGARRVDDDRRLEGAARRRQMSTAAAPR